MEDISQQRLVHGENRIITTSRTLFSYQMVYKILLLKTMFPLRIEIKCVDLNI